MHQGSKEQCTKPWFTRPRVSRLECTTPYQRVRFHPLRSYLALNPGSKIRSRGQVTSKGNVSPPPSGFDRSRKSSHAPARCENVATYCVTRLIMANRGRNSRGRTTVRERVFRNKSLDGVRSQPTPPLKVKILHLDL